MRRGCHGGLGGAGSENSIRLVWCSSSSRFRCSRSSGWWRTSSRQSGLERLGVDADDGARSRLDAHRYVHARAKGLMCLPDQVGLDRGRRGALRIVGKPQLDRPPVEVLLDAGDRFVAVVVDDGGAGGISLRGRPRSRHAQQRAQLLADPAEHRHIIACRCGDAGYGYCRFARGRAPFPCSDWRAELLGSLSPVNYLLQVGSHPRGPLRWRAGGGTVLVPPEGSQAGGRIEP